MDRNKVQPIIELYTCIQTEGSKAGIPHFLIRLTGCTHRCCFGEGGWCDSWYASIHPEKGSFTLNDVIKLFDENWQIAHVLITGGSPTLYPELVNDIVKLSHNRNFFVTIETEGSHAIKTDTPIDLISLSPKFNNSIPKLGALMPHGGVVTDAVIDQHNKYRCNAAVIEELLSYHTDYHFKPVVDRNYPEIWEEIDEFIQQLCIPFNKIWVMPAGDDRENLMANYSYVIEECVKRGFNFSGRDHIIAYGKKRGV
jgi:7-carboxy-7-deazaguanine synthase